MRDFLSAIWPEGLETIEPLLGELRLIKGGKVEQSFVHDVGEAEAEARTYSDLGYDVYFGVLPRLEERGGGDAIPDVTNIMWADFDAKAFNQPTFPWAKQAAFTALSSVAPQPQIVVDSGNGYHGYWLLDRMYPFAEVQEVMKGMRVRAGADKTYDKARILRVPGTLNHKDCHLTPNGRVEMIHNCKPVRLIRFDLTAPRHRLSDFVEYAEAGQPPQVPSSWPDREAPTDEGWNPSKPDAPKFAEGGRNNNLTSIAGIMFRRGMNEAEVLAALEWENSVRCDPPLMEREVEQIVRSVARYHR